MTHFVNYTQILEDFRATLEAGNLGFKKVLKNASDMDFEYPNMPMADCRLKHIEPVNTAGQTYYIDIQIEVEVAVFDMTSRDKAATIRDGLTDAVQRLFQQNPHFSAMVDTVQIGAVDFETGETKAQGEFVAAAVAQFHAKLYSET